MHVSIVLTFVLHSCVVQLWCLSTRVEAVGIFYFAVYLLPEKNSEASQWGVGGLRKEKSKALAEVQ